MSKYIDIEPIMAAIGRAVPQGMLQSDYSAIRVELRKLKRSDLLNETISQTDFEDKLEKLDKDAQPE